MSKQQQRIAIAEACNWTDCQHVASINLTKGIPPANNPPKYGTYENGMAQLPDYLNDLNAMHEAEKVLMHDDPHAYGCYDAHLYEECSNAIHATAAQRAEAFLKTIGKWEETK